MAARNTKFLFATRLSAQTITGSIVGSVINSNELAVAGAPVSLPDVSTGARRKTITIARKPRQMPWALRFYF